MLETLKQTIIINFSITLNSWIYFLKRIPFVKVLFKQVGYEHAEITKVMYVFALIYNMIAQVIKSVLLLGLSFGVIFLFLREDMSGINQRNLYWQIFILFYVLLALPNNNILEPHRRKFISVKLMRMNARSFVIADYFPKLIWRQIAELPLFYLVARIYHIDVLLALFMVVAKNFATIASEALQIRYYHRTGKFYHNKIALNLLYSLLIIGIGYYSTLNHIILELPDIAIIALGVTLWTLGIFSANYIISYQNYAVALNDANRLDKLSVDMNSIKKNAAFTGVKLKDKEFSADELKYDKSNRKEGFTYINDIFFRRHKRILNKPIQIQVIILLGLFLASILASFLIPDFHTNYLKLMKRGFPALIFALYLMSTGQKATRAMFYNCDISLLHYGFYKTKGAVLATFTIRLKHLIVANMIPAGILAIELILLDVLLGGSGMILLPIGIMTLVLSVFFVIHNLFLYYIFQPYTTDLTVKNPMYKLFSSITYLLCYISMQIKNVSITFLVFVVVVTLIYSVAALITVYRVAPKTFTIK